MAAGDLLPTTGEMYAAEVNSLLLAPSKGWGDADWWLIGVDGLFDATVRDQDTEFDLVDGAIGAVDTDGVSVIVFTLACHTGLASTAELAIADLRTAFRSGGDTAAHLWVPGPGHVRFDGRTRGAKFQRLNMAAGVAQAQATFHALDPTIHVIPPPEEP